MILNYNLMIHDKILGDSAQNDPIDCRIKGFSFCDFKDSYRHSRGKFSLFFWQNLTFNHSLDTKMSLEEEEASKRLNDWDISNSIARNIQNYISCRRERINNVLKLGVTVRSSSWWDQQSRWNPKRRIVMIKSRLPNHYKSVRIAPRYLAKRALRDLIRPILNRCYNSSDERLGLICFNKANSHPFRCCHVPP